MWTVAEASAVEAAAAEENAAVGPVTAPMPGTVTLIDVTVGDSVAAGQRLMVVEAMKMEHPIVAGVSGLVEVIEVAVGDRVGMDERLAVVAPRAAPGDPSRNGGAPRG
jgi:acetyl-CoA/propionyl-CoA carboxylase biotin carboxyl carrier protein